jgi:glycine hydroxymethyltransferase
MIKKIIENIEMHEQYMNNTINLIASENKMSYLARKALVSDYGNRVAEGWIDNRLFPGIKYYNEIEEFGMELIKEMFDADFVDLRPISGTMANMVVYAALTNYGDTILAPAIRDGGHISMSGATPKRVFNLNVINIPMIEDTINEIDVNKTKELLHKIQPKILLLGGSVIIKELEIEELCKCAHNVGTIVVFDASHISGLIVGHKYTNPFKQGVDILTTSTCKTIPGPQHGLILSKKEFSEKIKSTTFPALHSGHHLNNVVSTIITMYEMKIFGFEYANQIRKNIVALGRFLEEYGFSVYRDSDNKITDTHMLMVLDEEANFNVGKLEKANIIANSNILPWDKSLNAVTGIRIGTPELTRIGMKEKDMSFVAEMMSKVLIKNENCEVVRRSVKDFRSNFQTINYCFNMDIKI